MPSHNINIISDLLGKVEFAHGDVHIMK